MISYRNIEEIKVKNKRKYQNLKGMFVRNEWY